MNKVKNLISFLISLFLLFAIMATSIVIFCNTTLLSGNYYVKVYEDNKIIDEMYDSINESTKYYMVQNNVPQKYLDEIMSKDEIKQEFGGYLSQITKFLCGDSEQVNEVNVDKYLSRIDDAFNEYVNDTGLIVNKVSTDSVNNLKNDIKQNLEAQIAIVNDNKIFETNSIQKLRKITRVVSNKYVLFSLIICDIMLFGVLLMIWKKDMFRFCSWCGSAFLSSGMLIFITFISGYLSEFYYNIPLSPEYVRNGISSIIKNVFERFAIFGTGVMLVGVALMAVNWMHILKIYKKNHN